MPMSATPKRGERVARQTDQQPVRRGRQELRDKGLLLIAGVEQLRAEARAHGRDPKMILERRATARCAPGVNIFRIARGAVNRITIHFDPVDAARALPDLAGADRVVTIRRERARACAGICVERLADHASASRMIWNAVGGSPGSASS